MIFVRSFLALIVLVTCVSLMTSCKQNTPAETSQENPADSTDAPYKVAVMLSPEDFEKGFKRNNAVLVDVRMPQEFEQGHIEGAININFFDPNFKNQLLDLKKNKEYYMYCKNDTRSEHAAEFLMKNDYPDVYVLEGGYQAWVKAKSKEYSEGQK